MVENNRTVSSRQLAAHWSTATGVLMPVSSIRRRQLPRGLRARTNHASICGTMTAAFVYAKERCLPECVIERHSGITPGVRVWGTIQFATN
ncbi:hypothetical protein TNCV_1420841 [Trichonephila clavipes]|nr:hypothetical protein TNCV_1420841 [Trichonephila clavipes]